jgi:protein-S-isoprenylcysteine O-methyltransferase Ste14
MALVFHLRVVTFEEPALTRQFGEQFAAYLRQVPRWIPRRPGSSPD